MDGKSRFFISGIFTYLAVEKSTVSIGCTSAKSMQAWFFSRFARYLASLNQTAPIDLPDGSSKIIERLRQKNQTALIGMISN